jgi:hypothetical protein
MKEQTTRKAHFKPLAVRLAVALAADFTNVSSFKSSEAAVALVDSEGLVRAKRRGKAEITAAFDRFTTPATAVVTP